MKQKKFQGRKLNKKQDYNQALGANKFISTLTRAHLQQTQYEHIKIKTKSDDKLLNTSTTTTTNHTR